MSLLSQKSRDLHATWRYLCTPEGRDESTKMASEEFFKGLPGELKKAMSKSGPKAYLMATSIPVTLAAGGSLTFWSLWDSMMATGDIGVPGMSSLIVAAVGALGIPFGWAKAAEARSVVKSEYRQLTNGAADRAASDAKRAYLASVHKDLVSNGHTVISSDSSNGSFVTHLGVVVLAEESTGDPTMLMNGKVLMSRYENISSTPARIVNGFRGQQFQVR